MSDNFEVIDRPVGLESQTRSRTTSPVLLAILDTLNTGQVVKVSLHGKKRGNLTNSYHAAIKRKGLNAALRTHRQGDDLLVWLVPKESSDATKQPSNTKSRRGRKKANTG